MIKELVPHEIGISVSYPLPGTGFYEKVKGQLKEKTNWTDSDDLALMYQNTYSKKYYKKLHRYVHLQFKMRKAWLSLTKIFHCPHLFGWQDLKMIISSVLLFPKKFIYQFQLKRYAGE
jgi:hypothetical protein